ncbi:MAG: helix-turn-helix domain-containing protein, partial [Myxococcota bacterium]
PRALRQRVVETYLEGELTKKQVAQRFRVSYSAARLWIKRYEETGSYDAMPDSGGLTHKKVHPEHERVLEAWLAKEPSLTQLQLAKMLQDEFGIEVCQATISNALKRRDMTLKKDAG